MSADNTDAFSDYNQGGGGIHGGWGPLSYTAMMIYVQYPHKEEILQESNDTRSSSLY